VSRGPRLLQAIFGSALVVTGAICSRNANAETIIATAGDNIIVETHDGSVLAALAAIGGKFDLHLRGLSSLDRPIEGRYEGSLRGVVTRLLNGYDYVMKIDGGRVEVVVLGVAKQSETRPANILGAIAPTKRRSD
jgi:hypothetical protein